MLIGFKRADTNGLAVPMTTSCLGTSPRRRRQFPQQRLHSCNTLLRVVPTGLVNQFLVRAQLDQRGFALDEAQDEAQELVGRRVSSGKQRVCSRQRR